MVSSLKDYKNMVAKGNSKKARKRCAIRPCVSRESTLSVFRALSEKALPRTIRRSMVDGMGKSEMKAVREVAMNFLRKNIPVNDKELGKLRRYKNALRLLSQKQTLENSRKVLKQHGGIFPLLLPLIIGAAGAAASGAIKGAVERKVRGR